MRASTTFLLLLQYPAATALTPPPSTTDTIPTQSPSSSSTSFTLDQLQLRALQFLHSPCTILSCDTATPFRHLLSLDLTSCSSDLHLSTTLLSALSTLTSLTFLNCHILVVHFPTSLHQILSTPHPRLPRSLHNLTHLYISGDPINALSGSDSVVYEL
ncbi:hypothetical protein L2E82_21996 [Cichorium intybus]|uniref:Uncharacterized protein n=1 Tax=Cichorium intybus TaxID=13427 RepID=A0ACB9DWT9_CICIN|nr:hypothetical protein L2E82_50588 [Cichorium intybus]KAI3751007.1 hypothetical protein L2E82_21996 [Cichorium intybus]